VTTDNRIFIYLDALLADFNIKISVPQKAVYDMMGNYNHGVLMDQSQVSWYMVAFAVDKVF